jgi:hypothetical protein
MANLVSFWITNLSRLGSKKEKRMFEKVKKFIVNNKKTLIKGGLILTGSVAGIALVYFTGNHKAAEQVAETVVDIVVETEPVAETVAESVF